MDPPHRNAKTHFRDGLVWIVLTLTFAGYPLAWILFSPRSVLRSTDPAFVQGFGAGVGLTLGVIAGVLCMTVAVVRFAGRLVPDRRPPAG
jgi:hypothetical protein